MDVICTEAGMQNRQLEAHADAEHSRRLGFIQQSTHVLVTQLNSEMNTCKAEADHFSAKLLHREADCHEEKQAALKLTTHGHGTPDMRDALRNCTQAQ